MNSADRHSLQFTINKIVYKIFGAMSKDLYIEISGHFGIESVENLIADRRNRFINRYGETDNYYLCQMLRWLVQFVWLYFLFIVFAYFRLLNFSFFHLCCATTYDGEIKLYIVQRKALYVMQSLNWGSCIVWHSIAINIVLLCVTSRVSYFVMLYILTIYIYS